MGRRDRSLLAGPGPTLLVASAPGLTPGNAEAPKRRQSGLLRRRGKTWSLAIGHRWLNLCPSIAQRNCGQAARPPSRTRGEGLLRGSHADRVPQITIPWTPLILCEAMPKPICRASRHSVEGFVPFARKKVRSRASPAQIAGTRGDERSADAVSPLSGTTSRRRGMVGPGCAPTKAPPRRPTRGRRA